MRSERNAIVRDVNPLLKEYCAKFNLDFQFVDMRWGVTEDSQIDHSVEKICLLEVENCQKISLGPNFIVSKILKRYLSYRTERLIMSSPCFSFESENYEIL